MNNENNNGNDDLASLFSKPVLNDSANQNNNILSNNMSTNTNTEPLTNALPVDNVADNQAINNNVQETVQQVNNVNNEINNNPANQNNNTQPNNINTNIEPSVNAIPADNVTNSVNNVTDNQAINNDVQETVQQVNNEINAGVQQSTNVEVATNSTNSNLQDDNTLNNNDENTESISDDYYIKEFIGDNSEKIMNKKFNFSAFFFGYLYFFYRKHFIFGIIGILQLYIIPGVLYELEYDVIPMAICSLIVSIILAALFNKFYVNMAKKEVDSAKNKYTNYELIDYLNKKGGTSGSLAFLGALLFVVPQLLGIKSIANYYDSSNSLPADGTVYYDTVVLENTVDITFPEGFTPQEEHSLREESSYSYIYEFDGGYCVIELNSIAEDKSAKSFANRDAKYYEVEVSKTENNGITWYKYKHDFDDYGYELYYVADHREFIFLLTFADVTKDNSCKEYFDSTLDSIKFK